MAGYCIELFKYMQIDQNFSKGERLKKARGNVRKGDGKIRNFLAYGEFDRIAFTEVKKFARFRDVSEKSKGWIGDRKIILAYEISEDRRKSDGVVFRNARFHERNMDNIILSGKLFIGITILQFKESLKESLKEKEEDLDSFLLRCKENILRISREKPDVKCSVLGTMGAFGIVILWLSDQFVDVLNLVTLIKNTNVGRNEASEKGGKSIFLSAYTVFAQNHPSEGEDKLEWQNKISAVQGKAVMHLTLKQGFSSEIRKELEEITKKDTYLHCVGEYDVMWQMDACEALPIVEKNSSCSRLYYEDYFYKKYVLQSTLLLCEDISPEALNGAQNRTTEIVNTELMGTDDKYLPELDDIQREYMSLRGRLKEQFPYTAGMVDTLDLLNCDYIFKISVASNEMWAEIYTYQILNILRSINMILSKMCKKGWQNSDLLKTVNRLLTDFEGQIFHIAESNNLIMATPSCQLRFSGQNNLVLYAYFGIMKNALEFVYQNQAVNKQDEIIPLIVPELVPKIESTLYDPVTYNRGKQQSGVNDGSRIVTINLSMTSLFEPACYYPYLYHEIFHYTVPKDRHVRNMLYKCLISAEFLRRIVMTYIKQRLVERSVPAENINDLLPIYLNRYVMQYIYKFTVDFFVDRDQKEKNEKGSNLKVHQQSRAFNDFFKSFYQNWVAWISGKPVDEFNPIYKFFATLFGNKDELLESIETFFGEEKVEDENLLKVVIETAEGFFLAIDGIIHNSKPESVAVGFKEMLSTFEEEDIVVIDRMVTGIREASADIAMVAIAEMDFEEYLLLFTKIKKDLLLKPDKKNIDPQDVVRIGMVLNYLHENEMDAGPLIDTFNSSKDNFLGMYKGLFYNIPKEGGEDRWNKICREANEWFRYWKKCYENYLSRYSVYAPFIREICKGLLVFSNKRTDSFSQISNDSIYWRKYADIIKARGNAITDLKDRNCIDPAKWDETLSVFDELIFDVNVRLIHRFQYQKNFKELNDIRNKTYGKMAARKYIKQELHISDALSIDSKEFVVSPSERTYRCCYKVDDIKNLSTAIVDVASIFKESCDIVLGKADYPIWYRGHESSEYILIPSIMRQYKGRKAEVADRDKFSLVNMIRKEYEEFRFRADGASEAIDRATYTYSDYIALMQHYSVASNFLDWTEDALSALYFALEGFLDKQKERGAGNATLYMFSPALYNEARLRMLQECRKFREIPTQIEKDVLAYHQGGIPNLAVDYNVKSNSMYLLGAEEYGNQNYIKNDEVREDKMFYYLPIAIYTSRLNKRIQAQNGTFLAYNVYTSPDSNDEFGYISLERIQEKYLELVKDEKNAYPFLYRIDIQESSREGLADWVSALGMSKERCYPELENIGGRIMR